MNWYINTCYLQYSFTDSGLDTIAVGDGNVVESLAPGLRPLHFSLNAADDAFHIALSGVHTVDYLLTWNFKHIDNALLKPRVRMLCTVQGHACLEICTPPELIGDLSR